ncbi:MAG: ADP-ribosylglycohydrolase family protein [Lachnospiraceae bacterium]|nr:ADP-ribosylglycohydrolase family protein [Lachnospiraceae bacterium]MDY5496436.1 ADP-ribosylglycohydrolase family protein [Anaerobutyricum sp.]
MNAGEREIEWMKHAYPVKNQESREESWNVSIKAGTASDEKLIRDWMSEVPGSRAPSHLVVAAVQCMRNRGYDVTEAEKYLDEGLAAAERKDGASLQVITSKIYSLLNQAPVDPFAKCWNYTLYESWDDIRKKADFSGKIRKSADVFSKDYEDRIYAGWTAQLVGAALGTQVEGYNTDNIEKVFGTITSYIRPPETFNDDITYEIAFLDAFDRYGYEVTSDQIAKKWLELIEDGYSAEEVALRNLRLGIMPPESGKNLNYYSDWVGVQMRTMIHGMVAPGNPELAAKLAVTDGVISHSNSGIIGGMFNAVLVSLAFVQKDVQKLVLKTAECIPKDSEYYSVVQFALNQCMNNKSWREAWRKCEEAFKEYNWIHVYPNVCAQIIALWFGEEDFDKTASIICMEGKDADCTAAPVLNTLGVMYGRKILPEKWTGPLGTTVHTLLRKYREFTIEELCDKTIESVRKNSSITPGKLVIH